MAGRLQCGLLSGRRGSLDPRFGPAVAVWFPRHRSLRAKSLGAGLSGRAGTDILRCLRFQRLMMLVERTRHTFFNDRDVRSYRNRGLVMLAALLALVMAFTAPASAQTAPSGKPITIVVP